MAEVFRTIAEAIPGITYHLDVQEGRYLYVNEAVRRLLGYEPAQMIAEGQSFTLSRMHPEDLDRVMRKHMGKLQELNSGKSEDIDQYVHEEEYRLRHANGEWRWFRSSAIIYSRTDSGQIKTILGIAVDITTFKKMEDQLALTDRMTAIGKLAAGAAHEINNPLAHVVTSLELITEELDRIDTSRGAADVALQPIRTKIQNALTSVDRIGQVARDLMVFGRGAQDEREWVSVNQVIESIIPLVLNDLRHRARLTLDLGESGYIHGNPGRLGQVVLNLLINAVQAIPLGDAQKNEIRVSSRMDASEKAVIEIRDTGAGIPPEQLQHIFEPFYSSKPVGTAAGLGLAICFTLVQSMGGELLAESQGGQGSVFRVVLPASAEPVRFSPTPGASRDSSTDPARAKVLVVDDDEVVAQILVEGLESQHDVRAVMSAEEALALFHQSAFGYDVVLCDLMMPQMTGMDLYREIQKHYPHFEDRFLFITGGALSEEGRDFVQKMSHRTIEKPFRLQRMRDEVKKVLERTRV